MTEYVGIVFHPEFEGKEIGHEKEIVTIRKAFCKEGDESNIVLIVQSGPINEVWGRIDMSIDELNTLI